ncbi:tuliposide A-converting enzyme 1, chloroplastic-like [Cicer arietinum]|uniref:Tuliposide A-converting enzyme 1, chloroplastic-like n=1 Tax=Cicer arietinum TaxID=3827 RepID=A0A1S3E4Q5_CICAR|nr:tuliposide A-converting enzyme 1, chloroplastic-like [Cicer arietinum]
MSLIAEAPEFLQVFSDGTVKRFNPETSPPTSQSSTNQYKYKSKDIIIDPSKPITARLFIPNNSSQTTKQFPLLVYFHGGGFCIGSTTWLGYNNFLADFAVTSQSIVLSIDYRLAPEHRLPIAYEDCYSSLEWIAENVKIEPFLHNADLSNVFLSGDSAGGNISHYVAVKAVKNNGFCPVKVKGLMLIHPYFGSEKRTEKEMEEESVEDVRMNDMFWRLSLPEDSDRDFFGCNFEKDEVFESVWLKFPAVEVYVAGKDFLKERGVMYGEFLKKKGVNEVKVVEAEEEKHVFHVFEPDSDATRLLQRQMSEFMKRFG